MAELEDLIARARKDDDALGILLDQHRAFLLAVARRDLESRVVARVDASDVVQQSFLEAHQAFPRFRGSTPAEVMVWLRRIVQRNAREAVRNHAHAAKRAVKREEPIDAGEGLARKLIAPQSSPSHRVARNQEKEKLLAALGALPEEQAIAVRMRHLDGFSLGEIAAYLGRSEVAAASLIKRGMRRLREVLEGGDHD